MFRMQAHFGTIEFTRTNAVSLSCFYFSILWSIIHVDMYTVYYLNFVRRRATRVDTYLVVAAEVRPSLSNDSRKDFSCFYTFRERKGVFGVSV